MPTTVAIMCGPFMGISGGDVHAFRLVAELERRSPGSVTLVAPPAMARHLPPHAAARLRPIATPLDPHVRGMAAYMVNVTLRMLLALVRAPRGRVDVATSHLFHDVIPCAIRHFLLRTRVVTYAYHLVEEERAPAGLRSKVSVALERLSIRLLRATRALIFVDNEHTATALRARGIHPAAIHMTGNAYDPWIELPPRRPADVPTAVFCGRFTEEKGVWDAIEIARALRERMPSARLVMIGDGPLREPAAERARELGLENVELTGFVEEAEKWRRLREAHVFLAPSVEEGWGIAVGEGLTAGLRAVVYDLPAYAHFGEAVERVPTGDRDALAEALVEALSQPADVAREAPALPTWASILDAEAQVIASA